MFSKISETVFMITEEDNDLDLFESRYPIPDGVTYNSYVIIDDKVAVLDTVDARRTDAWLSDLEKVLGERVPDYLVIHHMEPDHAANIATLASKYPSMKLVGNERIFKMIGQFFDQDYADRRVIVEEGSKLELGKHTLTFVSGMMVHWPEVMVSYESSEKLLFSADAFGRFGPADPSYDWVAGARRYYYNIVGKFGKHAAKLLNKAASLDIAKICPLHGPVLEEDLGKYVELYVRWANYQPDIDGVFIAYNSVYGNTEKAAFALAEDLKNKGVKYTISDVSRVHVSYLLEDAFAYSRMAVAATTYENEIFPEMKFFIDEIASKTYRNRKVGIIDNGTWGPAAGKKIAEILSTLENIEILEPMISIKSSMKEDDRRLISELADKLAQ